MATRTKKAAATAGNTPTAPLHPRGKANGHADPASDRRSLRLANSVKTGEDFANLMNAVMFDVLAGTLTPGEANAVISAGRQTLRIVEMTYRYGMNARRPLVLMGGQK